jgi:hypothetical protein
LLRPIRRKIREKPCQRQKLRQAAVAMDPKEDQQPQRQEQVVEAAPTCGLHQCAEARDHHRDDDDVHGRQRRHEHQADDRNKQRQKEEDGTALDAFSAVFDAEETGAVSAPCEGCSGVGQGEDGDWQDIKIQIVSGQKQAQTHRGGEQQVTIGLPFDPMERSAQARVREAQDQHDDERHTDQHIDRPAVRKEPGQQDRVKTGSHMYQLALHLRADLHAARGTPDQGHQTQQDPDGCQGQRDLRHGAHPATSSTTKSE